MDEQYSAQQGITANEAHVNDLIERFISSLPSDEAYHGSQKMGLPWGSIRTMDEIAEDGHLEDRGFYIDVEHPELGRSFTYPGPAALYNGSPWQISRRAPLIGEHNVEVYCGELGLTKNRLAMLAESGIV